MFAKAIKGLFLTLLAHTPLLAGLVQWWPQVQNHPVVAVLACLLYEGSLLAIAFTKEVWKVELKKDAISATADWVRVALRNFRPGFRRRYSRQMRIAHEIFNVRGLGLIDAHTLKLDQVYVDLKISPFSNPQKFNLDPIAVKSLADYRSIWDFLRAGKKSYVNNGEQKGESHMYYTVLKTIGDFFIRWHNLPADEGSPSNAIALAIVGPPGCGKTTLLQHVAVSLAANSQRRFRIRAYIPILLFLRNHADAINENQFITLGDLAQQHFTKRYPKLKVPPKWFDRVLEKERCLALLDGLDEVADTTKRKVISGWVDQQIANYPKCRFVVTSRPQGYQSAPLERAHIVEVLPFNVGQVNRFIRNWYFANEFVSAGHKVDDGVLQRANEGAEDLLHRLSNTPALRELTANPLLLTMISMVHRYRGQLPGSRVALYKEICEVLLERWRQAKGAQDELSADQKRSLLMPLAAHMMEGEIREISTDDAMALMKTRLARVGVTDESSEQFLNRLQESSGLLLEREPAKWGFAHLTFQEYLTASWWLTGKQESHDWDKLVDKSWWHEALRLYSAQGDATPILQACLNANNISSLTLAAEIMHEGAREIAIEVRGAVTERLQAALESSDPNLRRLATEVRISQRLKSLYRIDDRREIDANYLTCAEYQLFLDEMRQQNRYHQPDHWTDYKFPEGEANAPICGMRAEDAVAFCEWLTRRQGANVLYRLPRPDEVELLPEEVSSIGTWCTDGETFSIRKLDKSFEREIRKRLTSISDTNLPISLSLSLPLDRVYNIALKYVQTRTRDLGLALDFYLDLDRCFVINRTLALEQNPLPDLSRDLKLSRDLDLDSARELAGKLDRGLTYIRDFIYNFERTHAFAHELDRKFAADSGSNINHPLERDLTTAQNLAHDLNLNFERVYGHARARTLDRNFAQEGTIDPARARAYMRDRELDQSRDQAYFEALALCANLLVNLLIILTTKSMNTARQTRRKYLSDLLQFVNKYNQELMESNSFFVPWYRIKRFLRQFSKDSKSKVTLFQAVSELHWWLQIIVAREAGQLPAWESIRILREQL